MGFVAPDPDALIMVFQDILSVAVEEDGLLYDMERVTAEQIREESAYSGVRVKIPAHLGTIRISLQVDVGIGDALVPEPDQAAFPSLLGDDQIFIRSYSRYLVVAEKFEAMVSLGEVNSRMKDYFDVWLLEQSFKFNSNTLREAITHTFARRGTAVPTKRPVGLSEKFHEDAAKQRQWASFLERAGITNDPPSLREVCDRIWALADDLVGHQEG